MYTIYILQSLKDGRTYVGYTADFDRRFSEHQNGDVRSTRYRRPLTILHREHFNDRHEAKRRELWWKSGAGRRKLRDFYRSKNQERGSP